MYTKDKTNRITLRLNDEQFEFVRSSAEPLGVSPSEFLRMVVNATMASSKAAKSKLDRLQSAMTQTVKNLEEEDARRENENAVQYDKL